MEMKPSIALAEAVEAQRQADLTAKRQIYRPFESSATGAPLSYIVDRLRLLEVAIVGGDLMTTGGLVAHTVLQGSIVLADFVAVRKVIEDSAHSEKLALQTDVAAARATLEVADKAPQMELPLENV